LEEIQIPMTFGGPAAQAWCNFDLVSF
jgi:hypothetical protein